MKQWLNISSIDKTRLFDVVTYLEKTEWTKVDIHKKMKIHLEEHTPVDKDYLIELSKIVNWDAEKVYRHFVTELQSTFDSGRKGKFGEILHGEILRDFHDLHIPIKKYQYQLTPNSLLHGTDLIAYKMKDKKIDAYFYIETKLRTGRDKNVLSEAFSQIIKSRDEQIPSYFRFILNQLFKTDHVLFKLFAEHGIEISPNDHFRIGMIFETSSWLDDYLDDLITVYDRSISNLTIDLIKIDSLNKLVQTSYKEIGVNIV